MHQQKIKGKDSQLKFWLIAVGWWVFASSFLSLLTQPNAPRLQDALWNPFLWNGMALVVYVLVRVYWHHRATIQQRMEQNWSKKERLSFPLLLFVLASNTLRLQHFHNPRHYWCIGLMVLCYSVTLLIQLHNLVFGTKSTKVKEDAI